MERLRIGEALALSLLLAGCVKTETPVTFRAGIDSEKTFLDENAAQYWTSGDEISVFRSAAGEKFRYGGQTGASVAEFVKADNVTPEGTAPARTYAVYPYSEQTALEGDTLSVILPDVQPYAEGSFGPGANLMVAEADGDFLPFRNVCSYLKINVYGGVRVRRIRLSGNSGEVLTGAAKVTPDDGIILSPDGGRAITLDCGQQGVGTEQDPFSPTSFWLVVPPISFSAGFTVEVEATDSSVFAKSTAKSQTFERNVIKPMKAFECTSGAGYDILSFALSDSTRTYEAFSIADGYIDIHVPAREDLTSLEAAYTHNGASVSTTGDFRAFDNPLRITVTGSNGAARTWAVRVFDLPIVYAQTPDGQEITSQTDWTKKCTVSIRTQDGETTVYEKVNLRGRGNSSWKRWNKKPYAIKLDSKAKVLGMPKHKRWCLLANCRDYTLLRNDVMFEVARCAEALEWTPSGEPVELIMNGLHLGCYYLCEQIKVDKNRLNIEELDFEEVDQSDTTTLSGGYLVEYDSWEDEDWYFNPTLSKYRVKLKSPDPDDGVPEPYTCWLKNYVDSMEAALKNPMRLAARDYLEYMDEDSYADWYLVMEIAGLDHESLSPLSCYMYKDRGGKMKAGPVWDFDGWTLRAGDNILRINKSLYYPELLSDPEFRATVKARWEILKPRLSGIPEYIRARAALIERSGLRDHSIWGKMVTTSNGDESLPYSDAIYALEKNFTDRISALDGLIKGL